LLVGGQWLVDQYRRIIYSIRIRQLPETVVVHFQATWRRSITQQLHVTWA